jgi:hypothetical protein
MKRTSMIVGIVVLAGVAWGFRERLLLLSEGPRSEHDEPVVIDNGPIRITRKGADPEPENQDNRKWEIHHSGPLKLLRSWSYSSDGRWHASDPISLSGIGDITFETIDPDSTGNTSSFALRRDQFWELRYPQKVRLKSSFKFTKANKELRPEDAAYEKHRIASVTAGGTMICFRESATPGPPMAGSKCQNSYAPDAVQIQLCVTEMKCYVPTLAPKIPDIPSSSGGGK